MAKISIPDKARPWIAVFLKYHFWMLSAIVPLALLPLLFAARDRLVTDIKKSQSEIDRHVKSLDDVFKKNEGKHPNESWSKKIDDSTVQIHRETLREWRQFWGRQQALRVWPESLGPDFLKAMESLKQPDGKLSRKLLERYQNNVRVLVRELPARMGVEDRMADLAEPGSSQPAGRTEAVRPGAAAGGKPPDASPHVMTWNAGNQQRIAASFNWGKVPTTAKVLLAQEELWVYGLLCDALARINKAATGPHDAAIATVDELYVGYPAAEDNPGGMAGGRIMRVAKTSSEPGAEPPSNEPAPPAAAGAPVGRPPNPRFDGQPRGGPAGGAPAPAPEEGGPTVNPDDLLRNWVYVDFTGKPLDAAELAAAADCQMVHLMPFVLRVAIDQRQIDAFLADLAASPIPVDVRQIRINVGGVGPATETAADAPIVGGPSASSPTGGRLYDVQLELRGTVGLATQPNEKILGLEPGQGDEDGPGDAREKPAQPPNADVSDRPSRRRIAS